MSIKESIKESRTRATDAAQYNADGDDQRAVEILVRVCRDLLDMVERLDKRSQKPAQEDPEPMPAGVQEIDDSGGSCPACRGTMNGIMRFESPTRARCDGCGYTMDY